MENQYTEWLENMVIMLSKSYQETHDMLLDEFKNKETNAFMNMPKIKGFEMSMTVDKISKKTENKGGISSKSLEGHANWLIEKYKKN